MNCKITDGLKTLVIVRSIILEEMEDSFPKSTPFKAPKPNFLGNPHPQNIITKKFTDF